MEENNITNEQNAEQQAPVAPAAAETATKNAPVAVETAHDDFDWSVDKRNVSSYSKEEKEKYDQTYDSTFKVIEENGLLTGTIVGITKTDVVINIGFKSDGLISFNEFRDLPGLKIGDEVEVLVVEKEDRDGNLHLSRKQARMQRAWERIVEVYKTGEVVTGTVTS
ncbi:S1 RNA-binding domain-containing protein, partial [Chitinophaga sp.]|uniref:S1 RNA-binding domain-containing protein n=1 Tax=Chitinophaga sp. TaxID=1869181 RepID=UPI002FDE4C8B